MEYLGKKDNKSVDSANKSFKGSVAKDNNSVQSMGNGPGLGLNAIQIHNSHSKDKEQPISQIKKGMKQSPPRAPITGIPSAPRRPANSAVSGKLTPNSQNRSTDKLQ